MLSKECLDLALAMFKDLIYTRDYADTQIEHFLIRGGPEALNGFALDKVDMVTVIRVLMDQIAAKDDVLRWLQNHYTDEVGRWQYMTVRENEGAKERLELVTEALEVQIPEPITVEGQKKKWKRRS